jgi:hypothetical protein
LSLSSKENIAMAENFKKNIGRLATDRYDFQDHLDGYETMRHKAEHVRLSPAVPGFGSDVQSAIEGIKNWISLQTDRTDGFYTVGDECNIYGGNGTLNTNKTPLDEILNPIFEDIQGTSGPPAILARNRRIAKGGVILIKAGTYLVKRTIKVPPGIVLMGEGFGTKIINATNLDLQLDGSAPAAGINLKTQKQINRIDFFPPTSGADGYVKVTMADKLEDIGLANGDAVLINLDSSSLSLPSTGVNFNYTFTIATDPSLGDYSFILSDANYTGTSAHYTTSSNNKLSTTSPIFSIQRDSTRSDIDAVVDVSSKFIFGRESVICNMLICDNFVEPTSTSDSRYKNPQNTYDKVPLIVQNVGSGLLLENVKIIGRRSSSSTTFRAISLRKQTSLGDSSSLRIINCFIDGFFSPIDFRGEKGREDSLFITNSKIRSYRNGNSSDNDLDMKSAIVINDCSAIISNNEFYGSDKAKSFVYLHSLIGTSGAIPSPDSRSNISLQSNIVVCKEPTFKLFARTDSTQSIHEYVSLSILGNNFYTSNASSFQDKFEIYDSYTTEDPFISYLPKDSPELRIGAQSKQSYNLINIYGETKINGKATVTGTFQVNGESTLDEKL